MHSSILSLKRAKSQVSCVSEFTQHLMVATDSILVTSDFVTDNFPQLSTCTESTTAACTQKADDCAFMMGIDDGTEVSIGGTKSRASLSPIMELNDEERKRWDEWEERDELSGRTAKNSRSDKNGRANVPEAGSKSKTEPGHVETASELECETDRETDNGRKRTYESSPSSLDSSTNRIDAARRRKEAQSKLLHHAKMAQQLNREQLQSVLSTRTEDTDVLSTAQSTEEKSMATTITTVQQEVLKRFSSMLRNDKVEVLKLNRHGKWQVRFITVSTEILWLNKGREPPTPKSSQCPQALLWYKGHNVRNTGLAGLKNDGRGGFLFSQLHKIGRDPNLHPPAPIPKKLKSKFRSYAGVKIKYLCDEGERDLLFCFQDKSDASAFCTAIDIIHRVVLRNADDSKSNL